MNRDNSPSPTGTGGSSGIAALDALLGSPRIRLGSKRQLRSGANGRNRRYLTVAARSGEGPLTGPLRTHSSRIANRYFVEFTAYTRASLTMGFAQLNPSYGETTENEFRMLLGRLVSPP